MPTNNDAQLISSISADKSVIKDIFSDNYLFTIPNYQRPYSWLEEHALQLLDDLHSFAFMESNFNDLPPYFLGSAVIIQRPGERIAQVVDGQQRLTTLTILLSCLRYQIEDTRGKATISALIFQSGDELLGTAATYRLKTRPRDQDFFKALVQEPNGLVDYFQNPDRIVLVNDAQKQILLNAKAYVEAFKKKYSQEQLVQLAKYIIQKCIIVIVTSSDEDMAFRIFNVLNDRGKDLTIADILKSEILEKVRETEQEVYTQKWEDSEEELGIEKFKDFFSHLRAIFVKKKAEKTVLEEIRTSLKPSEKPEKFIDRILIPFANAYSNIEKEDYTATQFPEQINASFNRLKRSNHTDWLPSAIYFVALHPNASRKIMEFLQQLEKLTLGMIAQKISLNERIERYALVNGIIERDEDLYAPGSAFLLNDKDRQAIINTLRTPDLYHKQLVKPVLAKIEEQMNDGSITIHYDSLSIEHILPQHPTVAYWLERFPVMERSRLTDGLGNLSLITVRKNSQAKNYEFRKKITVYFKMDGRASNLGMVNQLSEYPDWNPETVSARSRLLLNFFLRALGLDPIVAGD